jgi:hypothetical protein
MAHFLMAWGKGGTCKDGKWHLYRPPGDCPTAESEYPFPLFELLAWSVPSERDSCEACWGYYLMFCVTQELEG